MVVIPSVWTIVKSQYDRFRVIVIVDDIRFNIHNWDNGDRYETRYFMPIKLVNNSNSIGTIKDMRLKVKYKIWGPFWASEIYSCDYELFDKNNQNFSYEARGSSLEQIVKRNYTPIVLKQNQIYETHLLFRCFWKETRMIPKYKVYFQLRCNRSRWKTKGKWFGYLKQSSYDLFIANNSTMPLMKWPSIISKFSVYHRWEQYKQRLITKRFSMKVEMNKIEIEESISDW
jgi:hypothetical protein